MKKIYKTPNTIIVRVQTNRMIASSPGYRGTPMTEETSGNLSRRRTSSIWDDDDEDDYGY